MLYELWQLWTEGTGAVGADLLGTFLDPDAALRYARDEFGVGTFVVTDAGGDRVRGLRRGSGPRRQRRPARLAGVPLRRVLLSPGGSLHGEADGPLPAA